MTPTATPYTITLYDRRGSFAVTIKDDLGERLSVSVPSGRQAGYAEARARCTAEAVAKVRAHLDRLLVTYRGAALVGFEVLDDPDPEMVVRERAEEVARRG